MTTEELVNKASKTRHIVVANLVIIAFLAVSASPFIMMWHSWYYGWRIGLSGIVLFASAMTASTVLTMATRLEIEGLVGKNYNENVKTKFKLRLEKIAEENGVNLKDIQS